MREDQPYHPIPETRHSIIMVAADPDADQHRQALDKLASLYLPALRSHLLMGRRWRGRLEEHFADDLIAQFMLSRVLEKRLLQRYDIRRRFRNLLLTALDNFIIDELRKRRIETSDLDSAPEPAEKPSDQDDAAFLIELMRSVIETTVERMKEECEKRNKPEVLAIFTARLIDPLLFGQEVKPYESLVEELGIPSVSTASNLMVTAKRSFKRHMADVCADLGDDAEELKQMFRGVLSDS